MIRNPKYEANIFPEEKYDNEFYTIFSETDSLQQFIEIVKEELSNFDPIDRPYALILPTDNDENSEYLDITKLERDGVYVFIVSKRRNENA